MSFARVRPSTQLRWCRSQTQIGGSTRYLPPEIVATKPGRSVQLDYAKSDVWAAGMILYELLAGFTDGDEDHDQVGQRMCPL